MLAHSKNRGNHINHRYHNKLKTQDIQKITIQISPDIKIYTSQKAIDPVAGKMQSQSHHQPKNQTTKNRVEQPFQNKRQTNKPVASADQAHDSNLSFVDINTHSDRIENRQNGDNNKNNTQGQNEIP